MGTQSLTDTHTHIPDKQVVGRMSARNYVLTYCFIKKRQISETTQNRSIIHLFQLKGENPRFNTLGCVSSALYPAVTRCVILLIQSWLILEYVSRHLLFFSEILKFISPHICMKKGLCVSPDSKHINIISLDSLIFRQTNLSKALF